VEELLTGVAMLEGVVQGPRYALGHQLTIADCALAPALFAVGVTAERLGMDLIEPASPLDDYAHLSRQDPSVGRVIDEMEQGLRHLVQVS
jgi:glutathione S-transferase